MVHKGDFYRIDKLLSSKAKPASKAFIDEKNMQIHIKDVQQQDPTQSFSRIVNDVSKTQVAQTQTETMTRETDKLNLAMKEAQDSFEAMMKFHDEIKEAYRQLVKMH